MKIKDWPVDDRPREKFIKQGAYPLSDTELIAIVVGKGIRHKTAVDIAKELIGKTGGINKIGGMKVKDLERLNINGLGRTKIITLLAAIHLGRRSLSIRGDNEILFKSPGDVHKYYHPFIAGLKHELFKVAAVDGKNRYLADTTVSKGILDASLVHPREVFKFALEENASSIFLIHNHPSGILKPSDDDLRVTERLCRAGEVMGIKIVDHIIITDHDYYSFSQHNLL